MNGDTNAVPEEQPVEQAPEQTAGQPGTENAEKALMLIYGDAKTFASLMELIKSGESDPTNGIAQATVMIVDKMEADVGELSVEELQVVGVNVVIALLDLAQKAGVIPEPSKEIGSQIWGKAIQLWMKKHPGRVDPTELQAAAQQQAGGEMQVAPAAPAQAAPQKGLLEV